MNDTARTRLVRKITSAFGRNGNVTVQPKKTAVDLLVTLWPEHAHFFAVAADPRVLGIRLNSAMISPKQLVSDLASPMLQSVPPEKQLFFDVKGRQLRVDEVFPSSTHLELRLNHPISVLCPVEVFFKAGADRAILRSIEEGGRRLIFDPGGPRYNVKAGESLHILDHSFHPLDGPQFSELELRKIEIVNAVGFRRYFLSYVESARDVAEFRELVGPDAEIWLKIESVKGLQYVRNEFRKESNLFLVAARGDLYIELPRPHQIVAALQLIIEKDPEACAGSRLMLSVVRDPVPDCADFLDLAWLVDRGYRRLMLCDEICLKAEWLDTAINAIDAYRQMIVANPSLAPSLVP